AADRLRQLGDVLDEDRLDAAGDAQRPGERAAVGGDDRRLARRVYLGEKQRVGGGQHSYEVLEEIARARVAVRLEGEHDAPTGEGAARRVERRRHFRGMVAVVVDQREAAAGGERDFAVALEPPPHAVELGERLEDRLVPDAELARHGDGGERVQHVVPPGQVERHVERGGTFA